MTTKVIRENTRKRFTEVAVAVEEIGNSMTLTLKALAEGKQDIEHLASEVEASVDNGTEVTEKLENLNQYFCRCNRNFRYGNENQRSNRTYYRVDQQRVQCNHGGGRCCLQYDRWN